MEVLIYTLGCAISSASTWVFFNWWHAEKLNFFKMAGEGKKFILIVDQDNPRVHQAAAILDVGFSEMKENKTSNLKVVKDE